MIGALGVTRRSTRHLMLMMLAVGLVACSINPVSKLPEVTLMTVE